MALLYTRLYHDRTLAASACGYVHPRHYQAPPGGVSACLYHR
jgi:hypothetical protein